MALAVQWDNPEKTVIRYSYEGLLGAQDHLAANTETLKMLDSVDHPVVFISDITHLQIPRDLLNQYSQVNRLAMFTHPKSELIVVVGVSGLLEMLVQIFGSVYKQRMSKIKIVSSLDEARKTAAEHLASKGQPS